MFRTFPPFVSPLAPSCTSFSRPTDTFDIRRTGSAVYFLLFVPFVTALGDVGERVTTMPPDAASAPVDEDWSRERESKCFTFVVSESRLRRGSGDEATYLLLMPVGMLTTVVLPNVVAGGECWALGDDATLIRGLLDIGIDELRLLPSNDMLRQLWTESGRVRLMSFLVMEDGPLDFCPLHRLLVLFVRLLLDGGPVIGGRPLGGLATKPFVPGSGILLGLLRFGVSGHFDNAFSRSC